MVTYSEKRYNILYKNKNKVATAVVARFYPLWFKILKKINLKSLGIHMTKTQILYDFNKDYQ